MEKAELISQTRLAFDFIQKLYFEVSYLIKEVEGLLAQEEEEFVFGRTGGYAVAARSSNGLDPASVNLWMYKRLAVFFAPKALSEKKGGVTMTRFSPQLKIIYLRIILEDKDIPEPTLYYGVLHSFVKKTPADKWPEKVEQIMTSIEYNEGRLLQKDTLDVNYEESTFGFKGRLVPQSLYDLHTSQDIVERVISPALRLYREI